MAAWPSRKSFLLVGRRMHRLPVLTAALAHHRDALASWGLAPRKSADEMFRAAVEMRRDHKAWGLRRRDVEGTWARVCRRALKQPPGAPTRGRRSRAAGRSHITTRSRSFSTA